MKAIVTLAACALLLQGCALALIGAGGAGGLAAADSMQAADRTFTAPLEQVRDATTAALGRMDLKPSQDTTTAEGRRIVAHTNDRTIDIELENVTYNTTRMTVDVKTYHGLLRDGATANEIVQKTGEMLAGRVAAPVPSAAVRPAAPAPVTEDNAQFVPVQPPPGPPAAVESQPLR